MNSMSKHSTIVLVTGANQGIGFEVAKKLASENEGYHILMGARDISAGMKAAKKLQDIGLSVEAIQIDVTSDESISKAAKWVEEKFDHLDVLMNNAGIAGPGIVDTRELFRTIYETNVIGQVQVTEMFIPLLEKSSQVPRIVFTSSTMGSITHKLNPDFPTSSTQIPAYRSSKTALNMLMAHYAFNYLEKGWKINACCPGYIATNLNSYAGAGTVQSGAVNSCRLAILGQDGETGTFTNSKGPIPF